MGCHFLLQGIFLIQGSLRGSGAGTLGVPLGGTRRVGGLLGNSVELFHPGPLGYVPGACVKLESDWLGCVVLLELC